MSRVKISRIENFTAFVAAAFRLADTGLVVEPTDGPLPSTEGCRADLVLLGTNRPLAVVVAPAGESRDAVLGTVNQALRFLLPSVEGKMASLSVLLPRASEVLDEPGSRSFAASGWFVRFDAEVSRAFDETLRGEGPKGVARRLTGQFKSASSAAGAAAVAGAAAGRFPAPLELRLRSPLSASAAFLVFPADARIGAVAVRFHPRSYRIVPGTEEAELAGARWFRFGVQIGESKAAGFWALSADEEDARNRLDTVAAAAPAAFGAGLRAWLGRIAAAESGRIAAAAQAVEAPHLSASSVFMVEGYLLAANLRFAMRAIVPLEYPARLGRALGARPSELPSELPYEADPLAAMVSLDLRFGAALPEIILDSFENLHDLLAWLGDDDFRLIVQNGIARRFSGAALATLLRYAEMGRTVQPAGLDPRRFFAVLPRSVRAECAAAIRDGAAAINKEDFMLRNLQAIETVVDDLRRGSYEPETRARALFLAIYNRFVFPRKRSRLDAAFASDRPFSGIRALPRSQYRAAVDRCDARTLAAALLAATEAESAARVALVASACSHRKIEAIRFEVDRLSRLLADGAIDPDRVLADRLRVEEIAAKVVEAARREAERRASGGPGLRLT